MFQGNNSNLDGITKNLQKIVQVNLLTDDTATETDTTADVEGDAGAARSTDKTNTQSVPISRFNTVIAERNKLREEQHKLAKQIKDQEEARLLSERNSEKLYQQRC